MTYVSREGLLAHLALAERDEESPPLAGALRLRLRELTRAQWRACADTARLEDDRIYTDKWHAAIFAAGVIDAESKRPLFTADEVFTQFSRNSDLWEEIARIAGLILDLSEVGADALKKESAPSSLTTDETTSTEAN
jgi:hypothetical protein